MHRNPFLPGGQEGETENSYFMSLIVFFHRLKNYNYFSFLHMPCLWAQPEIPVNSPCGLFPRTFLVRSVSQGCTPGFYSLPRYWSAYPLGGGGLRCHCVTAKPGVVRRMAQLPQWRVLWGQCHSAPKHCPSPILCRLLSWQKLHLYKNTLMFDNLEMDIKWLWGE